MTAVVPPELAVGKLLEVWAAAGGGGRREFSAHRRYSTARARWEESAGLTRAESHALCPGQGAPWSAVYLTNTGRGDEVARRLARAGVRPDELGRLREAAARWLDEP